MINKIKYIIPFVSLIHSIDSLHLLGEVDSQAAHHGRTVDCLLQVHISQEETKFGFTYDECREALRSLPGLHLEHVRVVGLMGMATNTDDTAVVRREFAGLKCFFDEMRPCMPEAFGVLSMGMSEDYMVAVAEGATMVRIGSMIFARLYDRHRRFFILSAVFGISIFLMLIRLAAVTPATAVILCILWGLAINFYNLAFQSEIIRNAPKGTAVAMSIYSGIYNIGIGGGALIGGYVCSGLSISYIGYVGGAIALLAAVLCIRRLIPALEEGNISGNEQ